MPIKKKTPTPRKPIIFYRSKVFLLTMLLIPLFALFLYTGHKMVKNDVDYKNSQNLKMQNDYKAQKEYKNKMNRDSTETSTNKGLSASKNLQIPNLDKYERVSIKEMDPADKSGWLMYRFRDGHTEETVRAYHANYNISFPSDWAVYKYTNESNEEDYGTNLLLTKGNTYILISQQLWETGSCVFDKNDDYGVVVDCTSIEKISDNKHIYTVDGLNGELFYNVYGVCGEEATDTRDNSMSCTPWINIGEVKFYTSDDENSQNYKEFVEILKNIEELEMNIGYN